MGIDLVKLLLIQHAAHVSGRAFKVLAYMAATALDRPNGKGQPARLYFAGEEPLVHVLYGLSANPTPTRLREVRRVLKELRDAGLIEPQIAKAGYDRRQSFLLRMGGALGVHSAPDLGGESTHPTVGDFAPTWVGDLHTPRTHVGPIEDLSQESITYAEPQVQTPRADVGETDGIRINPGKSHAFEPDDHGHFCSHCSLPASHQRHDPWSAAS